MHDCPILILRIFKKGARFYAKFIPEIFGYLEQLQALNILDRGKEVAHRHQTIFDDQSTEALKFVMPACNLENQFY